MSLDVQDIYKRIEVLRSELTREYEKCIDNGGPNPKVIALSQKMDQLILDYVKMTTTKSNNKISAIVAVE